MYKVFLNKSLPLAFQSKFSKSSSKKYKSMFFMFAGKRKSDFQQKLKVFHYIMHNNISKNLYEVMLISIKLEKCMLKILLFTNVFNSDAIFEICCLCIC